MSENPIKIDWKFDIKPLSRFFEVIKDYIKLLTKLTKKQFFNVTIDILAIIFFIIINKYLHIIFPETTQSLIRGLVFIGCIIVIFCFILKCLNYFIGKKANL